MKNYKQAIVVVLKNPLGYVLTKKPGEDVHSNTWVFPGGYVKLNEELDDAVKREMKEELHIALDSTSYVTSRFDATRKILIHYFYAITNLKHLTPHSDIGQITYASSQQLEALYNKKHFSEWPVELKSLLLEHCEFLMPTKYCNSSHPEIKNVARDCVLRYKEEKEIAIHLFHFVRDYATYKLGHWQKCASETLRQGSGTCTNKANLLVALLRAAGIPAGFGIMRVIGAEYFGPIVLTNLKKNISNNSKHIYCYAHLKGSWFKCDPSDDIELSISTQHLNPPSTVVSWNGESNAMLQIAAHHIISDDGPFANIDFIMEKKQRKMLSLPVTIANHYIKFLRDDGGGIKEVNELEKKFLQWLKKEKFPYYLMAKMYFKIRKLI